MNPDMQILLSFLSSIFGLPLMISMAGVFGLHRKIVPVRERKLPGTTAASTNGLRILIDSRKALPSALEHEWDHVELIWKMGLIGHSIAKAVSARYAVYVEARAYAVSVKHGRDMDSAARALAHHSYGFDLTEVQARRKIERYL